MKRPSVHDLQAQCDRFNKQYSIGQRVSVLRDNGEAQITHTRSAAEVIMGHTAVIWLANISGCYMLDRVSPIIDAAATD